MPIMRSQARAAAGKHRSRHSTAAVCSPRSIMRSILFRMKRAVSLCSPVSRPDRSRYFQAIWKDCARNSGSVIAGQRPQGTSVPILSASEPRPNKMRRQPGTRSRPARWNARNQVVPTSQPRSALKGPVLVPRARGLLMQINGPTDLGLSSSNLPETPLSPPARRADRGRARARPRPAGSSVADRRLPMPQPASSRPRLHAVGRTWDT